MNETRERNKDIIECLKSRSTMNIAFPGGKSGYFKLKDVTHLGKRMILAHERTGLTQVVEAETFFRSLDFNKEEREEATIILKLLCR